ncbi:hypothetical protein ES703_72106 [subsurface metagenome]
MLPPAVQNIPDHGIYQSDFGSQGVLEFLLKELKVIDDGGNDIAEANLHRRNLLVLI